MKEIRSKTNGVSNKGTWGMWLCCLIVSTQMIAYIVFTLATPPTVHAADFPVGDVTGLIDAINNANDEVTNQGPDTINLVKGTYTLNAVFDFKDGPNGLPSITSKIIINGNGATIERSRAASIPAFRIFRVAGKGELTLEKLNINNGKITKYWELDGGGIFNKAGRVLLVNCTLRGNKAITPGYGGGISNIDGTVELINSTVIGNKADLGGGIYNSHSGELKLTNCTITGNVALGVPYVGIEHGRSAGLGNGFDYDRSAGFGGGIYSNGKVELINNTIAGNGGVFESGGGGKNPVGGIAGYGSIYAVNTIVAKQLSGTDCGNSIFSKGHNLDSDGTCGFTGDGDQQFTDPHLRPFSDPGTPGTGYFALRPDSPAIDNGNDSACPESDQIGKPRIDINNIGTGVCDIGAIEFFPVVNNMVDFIRIEKTFMTIRFPDDFSPSECGCPDTSVGLFKFQALLINDKNKSESSLSNIMVKVHTLTNGNKLVLARGNSLPKDFVEADTGGEGALWTLPPSGSYHDGILKPTDPKKPICGALPVFGICLKEIKPFMLYVDVLGKVN